MTSTFGAGLPLRRFAAVLIALEALVLMAAGVWLGSLALTHEAATGSAAAGVASVVAGAVALGWAAHALWRGKSWPRGLAITWQVLQCAAGYTVFGSNPAIGVALIAVGVLAGAALVMDVRRDAAAAQASGSEPFSAAE